MDHLLISIFLEEVSKVKLEVNSWECTWSSFWNTAVSGRNFTHTQFWRKGNTCEHPTCSNGFLQGHRQFRKLPAEHLPQTKDLEMLRGITMRQSLRGFGSLWHKNPKCPGSWVKFLGKKWGIPVVAPNFVDPSLGAPGNPLTCGYHDGTLKGFADVRFHVDVFPASKHAC